MRRGDIVLVELPRPLGSAGREQFGYRPAVVLQDTAAVASPATLVIVPLTSNAGAAQFPGAFAISPTATNGLSVRSVVMTNQVRAIDIRRIDRVLGQMASADMATLESNLRLVLRL